MQLNLRYSSLSHIFCFKNYLRLFFGYVWISFILLKIENNKKIISRLLFTPKILFICIFRWFKKKKKWGNAKHPLIQMLTKTTEILKKSNLLFQSQYKFLNPKHDYHFTNTLPNQKLSNLILWPFCSNRHEALAF